MCPKSPKGCREGGENILCTGVQKSGTISHPSETSTEPLNLPQYLYINVNSNLGVLLNKIAEEVGIPYFSLSKWEILFCQHAETLLAHIKAGTWGAYLPELDLRPEKLTFLTQRACVKCNEHLQHSRQQEVRFLEVGSLKEKAELLEHKVNKLKSLESEIRLLADIPGGISDYIVEMERERCF